MKAGIKPKKSRNMMLEVLTLLLVVVVVCVDLALLRLFSAFIWASFYTPYAAKIGVWI